MQDLSEVEDREAIIETYLGRSNPEEDFEGIGDSTVGEQKEQEIETMPADLATPISLKQAKKDEEKKKKKKKKKSKTSSLPEAGSELADDYIEKNPEDLIDDPFDPENPLSQRIEYAIWKYRKNHKFSDERRAIFDNYLKFGGIKTGPNMFLGRSTGADAPDDPEAVLDFEAAKTAIDAVPDELEEGIEVNFAEVAQVYLGNTFVREGRFITLTDFVDAPNLIDAFLRYLEIRNVAPEYADDIAAARAICTEAKVQLSMCKKASGMMTGTYNKACASLFGKLPSEMDTSWMNDTTMHVQKQFLSFMMEAIGTTSEESKKIVQAHIKDTDNVKLIETKEGVFLKVTDIAPFDEDTGKDKLVQVMFENTENIEEKYSIPLERKIVENLMIGMFIRATLCQLSNGDWYFDSVTSIMPTFFMEDDCLDEEDYE